MRVCQLYRVGPFVVLIWAIRMYQETGLSAEGHRHYPLRRMKALRRAPATLLPLCPFLDDWGWERVIPSFGRPQELINKELEIADLVVVLFWNRIGSPSSKTSSKTGTIGRARYWDRLRRPSGGRLTDCAGYQLPGWRVILMARNSKSLPLAATSFRAYELELGR
jgi:hypothetical protein